MYSSRMRTARLLSLSEGGGSASGGKGVCIHWWGRSASRDGRSASEGQGVCIQGRWGSASREDGGLHPVREGVGRPPHPCEQTDRCKNITLPQTSFAVGNEVGVCQ